MAWGEKVVIKIRNAVAWIRKEHNSYYKFGANDTLPNEIIKIVNDSGTARACVTKLAQFTQANGLADTTLGNSPANRYQNYNSVISELSLIVSYLRTSSFRVLYDTQGEPAAIYPVPTQKLRRRGYTKFIYNDLMGEPHRNTNEDKELFVFDPKESTQVRKDRVEQQIKDYGEQFGDIVYHFKRGVGLHHDLYAVPDYYSGIDDIQSDTGISRIELRNIKKGWSAQVIISGGVIDRYTKDENGKTQWDYFNEDMKSFTGEEGKSIIYISGTTPEAKPTVTTINTAEILDATANATDRIGRKVCRLMGVPPVLVGFETAGKLGDIQELENTMKLFKMTVIESQDLIKESLRIVWPDKNWDINPLTLWETVEPPKPATP